MADKITDLRNEIRELKVIHGPTMVVLAEQRATDLHTMVDQLKSNPGDAKGNVLSWAWLILPKPCSTHACPSAKVSLPRDLLESLRLTKEKTGQRKQFQRDPQATCSSKYFIRPYTNYTHGHYKLRKYHVLPTSFLGRALLHQLEALAFGYFDEKPIDTSLMKFLGLYPSTLSWYLEFAFAFSTSLAPFTTNVLPP
ncbi:hypothetical protein BHM03_00056458 [Ensete ventricosum]|nr:hypothetical protein BHM03_00056458 [Ensete ventricosum]